MVEDSDDFDYVSARIGAATRIFLEHLSSCEQLVTNVGRNAKNFRRSPAEADAAKRLSRESRNEIEALADEVLERFPSVIDNVIESLIPSGVRLDEDLEKSHHPLSAEEEAAFFQFLREHGINEELDKAFSKYREDHTALLHINATLVEKTARPPQELLAEALLPTLVSAFERFLGALVRTGLWLHPKGLGSLPDVPYERLRELSSISDVERYAIDQKVDAFLKDSPSSWATSITRWSRIDLASLGADWSVVAEAIQRRHVVIHNGGRVDADYLRNVPSELADGVRIGQQLRCSSEYTDRVIENFRVLAMVLALRWAHHFGKLQPLEVLPDLVDNIYDLEREGRWSAAFQIANTSIGLHGNDRPLDELLQINWWLCKKKLGLASAEMIGEIHQWRPSTPDFEAARFALLDEDESLARSVREYLASSPAAERRRFGSMVIWDDAKARSEQARAAFSGRPASQRRNRKSKRSH